MLHASCTCVTYVLYTHGDQSVCDAESDEEELSQHTMTMLVALNIYNYEVIAYYTDVS